MEHQGKQRLENQSLRKRKDVLEQGIRSLNASIGSMNRREFVPFPGSGPFQGKMLEVLPDRYIVEAAHDGNVLKGVLLRPGSSYKIEEGAEDQPSFIMQILEEKCVLKNSYICFKRRTYEQYEFKFEQ